MLCVPSKKKLGRIISDLLNHLQYVTNIHSGICSAHQCKQPYQTNDHNQQTILPVCKGAKETLILAYFEYHVCYGSHSYIITKLGV